MNYLNIDEKKVEPVVKELNFLLADYHLYYQKLRNLKKCTWMPGLKLMKLQNGYLP